MHEAVVLISDGEICISYIVSVVVIMCVCLFRHYSYKQSYLNVTFLGFYDPGRNMLFLWLILSFLIHVLEICSCKITRYVMFFLILQISQ